MDVGDQSPLEASAQSVFERRDLCRRAVGRDHDLPAVVVQGVERVEELFLRLLATGKELDVVDEQNVGFAVAPAEDRHLLFAHTQDELVHELLAGHVADGRVRVEPVHLVPDRVQQVRLPQAGAAVDEKGVVTTRRLLGDGLRRGVREAVRRPGDERLEQVAGIERRCGRRLVRGRLRGDRLVDVDGDLVERHAVDGDFQANVAAGGFTQRLGDRVRVPVLEPLLREGRRRGQLDRVVVETDRPRAVHPRARARHDALANGCERASPQLLRFVDHVDHPSPRVCPAASACNPQASSTGVDEPFGSSPFRSVPFKVIASRRTTATRRRGRRSGKVLPTHHRRSSEARV